MKRYGVCYGKIRTSLVIPLDIRNDRGHQLTKNKCTRPVRAVSLDILKTSDENVWFEECFVPIIRR